MKASSAKDDGVGRLRGPASFTSQARKLYTTEIDRMFPWYGFPRKLRRFFVAQNGKCAYCGRLVEFRSSLSRKEPIFARKVVPSCDHVRPWLKSKGHNRAIPNRVLACAHCNHVKGARQPYPCEILFAEITGEIVLAMLPPSELKCYLSNQLEAEEKDEASDEDTIT